MVNSPVAVIGKIGQALSFNGTSQYVSSGMAISGVPALTVSAWMNADAIQTATFYEMAGVVTEGVSGAANVQLGLTFASGSSGPEDLPSIGIKTTSGYIRVPATNPISVHKWYLLSATYNGALLTLYLNGVQIGQVAATGAIVANTGETYVGKDIYGNTTPRFFNGSIDDVRIYNRALSAAEVEQLYDLGTANHQNATVNPPNLQGGLAGHWTFDGPTISGTTVKDVSENGNNGTMVNGPTPVAGVFGQALSFNGTNQYIDAGQASSLGLTNAVTVSAWAKPSAGFVTNGGWNYLVGNDTAGYDNTSAFSLFQTWGQPNFNFKADIGSNQYSVPANTTFVANRWYQVVGTYDGSYLRFYTNGVLDSTPVTVSGNINSTTQHLLIGVGRLSYSEYFKGSIDDVRIYNRALSASEVKQLYNLGR